MPRTDRQRAEARYRFLRQFTWRSMSGGMLALAVVMMTRLDAPLAERAFIIVGMVLPIMGVLTWHFRCQTRLAAEALASDDPAALRVVANTHLVDRVTWIGFLAIFVLMVVLVNLFG